ncbi:amino acid adenylation domain-containing protein [Dyadobacter sp. CY327]|uniref:non-ribosomal peptide synthetase n=1 Tax=Dyadobacter sp. CY327 TaxID=2907301 RepID=UPI001F384996|nr:non-ribosomal peptide synthetase [Dyadobacter sp. CY327]MCE7071044.1 amino acid adenylation domain-containing protein [Dyadobacter sp. CY327]
MIDNVKNLRLIPVEFDPFAGPEIEIMVPATESQLEIWLACAFGGDDANRSYNESVSLRFQGALDCTYLEKALNSLTRHHEALRSTFSEDGKTMCIFRDFPINLDCKDISAEMASTQEKILAEVIQQEAMYVFDLAAGPLFKPSLIKLSESEFQLILTAHHIICDGWSMGIIMQDLSAFYSAHVKHSNSVVQPSVPFRKYAKEQIVYTKSTESVQTEKFWVDQYQENIPVCKLPTDYPRPAMRKFASERIDFQLEPELIGAVKKMGVKAGSSLVTTLLYSFEVLLHKVTGEKDIVVGLPAAGQSATGNHRLVGHCVNLLPIRSHLDSEVSFAGYIKSRRGYIFDAFENQQISFGSILKKLKVSRDPSRGPLVQVIFNVDMGISEGVDFYGLDYQIKSNPKAFENFELFLNASGSEKSLILECTYNTALFKVETVRALLQRFQSLLKQVVANPEIQIKHINSSEEKKQVDHAAAALVPPILVNLKTVHALIAAQAKALPDKMALKFGNTIFTYQELDQKANQLARYLLKNNVQKGDLIGLSVDRSAEMVIALLAILKSGAAYIPLDPAYPKERIGYMLENSRAKFLITSAQYNQEIAAEQVHTLFLEKAWQESETFPSNDPEIALTSSDLAYVLYTSGSTGKPKGVQISHGNLSNFLISMSEEPGIKQTDRLLAVTTISFDIAGLELYLPLIVGAELVLANSQMVKDGGFLLDLVEGEQITFMQATPSTWRLMLDSGWEKKFPIKILCGGEALPKDLAGKLIERSESVWNMYGPTETTIWSTLKRVSANDDLITVGKPILNTQIYILNDDLQLVKDGEIGEIWIGGDGVSMGYLQNPVLTAERFIPDRFSKKPGQTIYRTGDLGKILNSGELQCLGRTDAQVKIRGHRIELGEIETVIEKMPEVKQAYVMVREDRPGDQRLVAYVVPDSTAAWANVPGWQEKWDVIYGLGVQQESNLNLEDQNLDAVIAEQLSNNKDIRVQVDNWLQQSVTRIKALKPQHMMEVGSGAGQILFAVAPKTKSYIATDYAPAAIDKLVEKLTKQPEKWGHTSAKTAMADDFSFVEKASLDLVLIHSVAQYFPDSAYLLKVIKEATKVVSKGGCIFIGDMQGMSTLKMHHAYDQLQRTPNHTIVSDFIKTVDRRVSIEDELLADPAVFYLIPHLIPEIAAVNIQLRKGDYLNETTKYHYDIWLYVGDAPKVVSAEKTIEWTSDYSLEYLDRDLHKSGGQVIHIKNIANKRTAKDYALQKKIHETASNLPIEQIKAEVAQINDGISPECIWNAGEAAGYQTHVRWVTDGTDNLFEAILIPNAYANAIPFKPEFLDKKVIAIQDYINQPFQASVLSPKEQVQKWKSQAKSVLPDYMIPEFVVMPKLPLTPNGKTDRNALPKPEQEIVQEVNQSDLPTTHEEIMLATKWKELLGLDHIGIHDDFFELGGHSLIAVQIITAIGKETGKKIPMSALFEYSTIHKFASLLQENSTPKPASQFKALVPIKPEGTKNPIYMIHGAGSYVMKLKRLAMHMDPDQPVFGLQAIGLNGTDEPIPKMEDIAAYYISEILVHNPDGPYAIAGYSFGGTIAFEMARQLKALGKTVRMVAMFDSFAHQSDYFKPKMVRFLNYTSLYLLNIGFKFYMFLKDPKLIAKYKLDALMGNKINMMNNVDPDLNVPLEEFAALLKKIDDANNIAYNNYVLKPYAGFIDLFRSKKRVYYMKDFKFLGWKPFALEGVFVHDIPGDHFDLFDEPNNIEFARILQNVLDKR